MSSSAAFAEPGPSGHLKLLPSLYSGGGAHHSHALDARVNDALLWDSFELITEGQVWVREQARLPFERFGQEGDSLRLIDMAATFDDQGAGQSGVRVDRLSLGWRGDFGAIRVGRQAFSAGSGLLFQVLDPFNPFSPVAIDKEYKTGDDMVTFRREMGSASDVHLVAIGRREEPYGDVTSDASSFVSKVRLGDLPFGSTVELLGAAHRDEEWYGAGLTASAGEGIVRADVANVSTRGADSATSFLGNYDRGFELFDRNAYGFIEYFRNGFGVSESRYGVPPQSVFDRVQRGELFTLGEEYLAVGGRIEVTPRATAYMTTFCNLQDGSTVAQVRLSQELAQEVVLGAGVTIPTGGLGDEFGTLILPTGTKREAPREVFLRLEWFWGR